MSAKTRPLDKRELDAQIAEKVYGLTVTWMGHPYYRANSGHSESVPFYTSEDAAAINLATKLQRDGWLVNIKLMPPGCPFIAWEKPVDVRACVSLQWMRRQTNDDCRKFIGLHPTAMDNDWRVALAKAALEMVMLVEKFGEKENRDAEVS
jgi:hypothetical protein